MFYLGFLGGVGVGGVFCWVGMFCLLWCVDLVWNDSIFELVVMVVVGVGLSGWYGWCCCWIEL